MYNQTINEKEIGDLFGIENFKYNEGQQEIIENILDNIDKQEKSLEYFDSLNILKTGGGKSICFQYPAIKAKGVTVVITPLVALMNDQAKHFNERMEASQRKERAIVMRSDKLIDDGDSINYAKSLSYRKKKNLIINSVNGEDSDTIIKIVYVSPEKMSRPEFMIFAKKLDIRLVVIDEAHCLTLWGWDFRPSYLKIIRFINVLEKRPLVAAFTATATSTIRDDIIKNLGLNVEKDKKQQTDINVIRDNLSLKIVNVSPKEECKENKKFEKKWWDNQDIIEDKRQKIKIQAILDYFKNNIFKEDNWTCKNENSNSNYYPFDNGKVIIYFSRISSIEAFYAYLDKENREDGNSCWSMKAVKYYAALSDSSKKKNIELFEMNNDAGGACVMLATKAFGMGIDMNNIDYVIHYDIPESIEDYYQQVGRAGRDASRKTALNPARCILFYDSFDISVLTNIVNNYISESEDDKVKKIYESFFVKYRMEKMIKLVSEYPINFLDNHVDEEQDSAFDIAGNEYIRNQIQLYFSDMIGKSKKAEDIKETLLKNYIHRVLKDASEDSLSGFDKYALKLYKSSKKVTLNEIYNILRKHEVKRLEAKETEVDFFNMNVTLIANKLRRSDYVTGIEYREIITDYEGADILIVPTSEMDHEYVLKKYNAGGKVVKCDDVHEIVGMINNVLESGLFIIVECSERNTDKIYYELKRNIEGVKIKQFGTVSFQINNAEGFANINYFDMMVADSVYTLSQFGKGNSFTTEDILKSLSGDNSARVYKRKNKDLGRDRNEIRILESLNKLSRTTIRIFRDTTLMQGIDISKNLEGEETKMLNITIDGCNISCHGNSALYNYAERGNGQFYVLPSSVLKVDYNVDKEVRKLPISVQNLVLIHFLTYRVFLADPFHGSNSNIRTFQSSRNKGNIIRLEKNANHPSRKTLFDILIDANAYGNLDKEDRRNDKYQRKIIVEKIDIILERLRRYYSHLGGEYKGLNFYYSPLYKVGDKLVMYEEVRDEWCRNNDKLKYNEGHIVIEGYEKNSSEPVTRIVTNSIRGVTMAPSYEDSDKTILAGYALMFGIRWRVKKNAQ